MKNCICCRRASSRWTKTAAAKKKQADLKKAVAGAYKPLFYDNNFAYINSPLYTDQYPGDHLKQIPLPFGCDSTLDIGGQYRARYHHERNHRGSYLLGEPQNTSRPHEVTPNA